jgi:syntaxin 1B/2/3
VLFLELRKEVGSVRAATDKIAQQMRLKMKKMRMENDDFDKSHNETDPSLVKIRSNMHGTLVRKFLDQMQEYQAMLTKYDKKFRDKAYKEVQIVAPDASPEDIDEVLESGGEEAIFQKHIMEDRKHAKAKQTLDYLKEKHNDLLALEKSITELNQLFMDMAILVETQGDLIDQIEFSVMNSKAFTEKAVETLKETEKIVSSTRKKKLCLWITIGLIIAVIVVVILIVAGVIPPIVAKA